MNDLLDSEDDVADPYENVRPCPKSFKAVEAMMRESKQAKKSYKSNNKSKKSRSGGANSRKRTDSTVSVSDIGNWFICPRCDKAFTSEEDRDSHRLGFVYTT